MNDFQMSFLSNARNSDHLAEAERSRLARSARPARTDSPGAKARRPRRLSLDLLFGRAGA